MNGVGLMMELGLTMLESRFVVRKIPSRARIRAYVCVHGCIYIWVCSVCGWTYARPWVCAHMSVGAYVRILQES